MKGFFVTLEGGEGSGKTTAIMSLKETLIAQGYDVLVTREPGGIRIAEQIREVILNPKHTAMEGRTEALLYAAARRQHLIEKVFPALDAGKIVLCDRFIDSSLAYQGHARGLGIDEVMSINQFAIEGCMPALTLFFDIKPVLGLERIARNEAREQNRLDLEALPFHEKVYEGYQMLVDRFPERIKCIDATKDKETVATEALRLIQTYI